MTGILFKSNEESLISIIAISLTIVFVFWIFSIIFTRYLLPLMLKIAKRSKNDIDDKILLALARPIRFLIFITGVYLGLRYLPILSYQEFASQCYRSIIIIVLAWGANALTGINSFVYAGLKERFKIDNNTLIAFLANIIRFIIWAMALVMIAEEWDYNVSGFVAGLGLGGLAFALAAQDALANIFGGIVIIMERPFAIGDWVETSEVEGIVEEISFRSTRFRTFSHALVTVPNAILANQAITNHSRMGKRRINFSLGVEYSTPHIRIEKCIQEIRNMLQNHPDIDQKIIFVYLDRFNDSSLDIMLYFYSKTTDWQEYLAVKENVNFRILDILEKENVSLAFPSRTVYIGNNDNNKPITG
ncbi:MAG: mechanosensitive ion channel family protein [Syntrophomonas sp.]|nr:mechanosensitive ion channel family protein [Syntrophomonas sp.]